MARLAKLIVFAANKPAWYICGVEFPEYASAGYFAVRGLATAVRLAVERGLGAAALFDVEGKPLVVFGALDVDEVRAIGTVLTGRMREGDSLARMLDGALMTASLDEREMEIGIAANCMFVVAIPTDASSWLLRHELRSDVESAISEARADASRSRLRPPSSSGGSSSGPAELPVIEWGVTVPRRNRD